MAAKKNNVSIQGWVYEHKLEKRITGEKSKNPGTEYINGSISIATDDRLENIIQVFYTYVVAKTKNGGVNNTYTVLDNIINGKVKTVMGSSREEAATVRVDTSFGVNDFYVDPRDGSDEPTLISSTRCEGGFIHVDTIEEKEEKRNRFEIDVLLNKCRRVDADEERNLPEKVILHGATFNFRDELIPIDLTVLHPGAMDYFESLELSDKNTVYTKLRGYLDCKQIIQEKEEEGAWGTVVREIRVNRKDFVVNWALPEPFLFPDESTISAENYTKMGTDRNNKLAEALQRYEDGKNNNNNTNTEVKTADFKF